MTNAMTPIEAAFELQRESIKQSQQLFQQGLDIQQNAAKTFLRNSLAVQRAVQRQIAELVRQLFDAQVDAVESALDEEEFRATVDRQVDEGAALTQQLLNAQFEQSADLARQLVNAQFEAIQAALDEEEYDVQGAIDRQFDDFEETQRAAWDEFEREVREAVDDLSTQQKELVAQSVGAVLDAQRETERQTVESVQQAEQVAETTQQQTEEIAETTRQQAEDVAATAEEGAATASEAAGDAAEEVDAQSPGEAETQSAAERQLEALEGIGSTYAEQLREHGIETPADLTAADVETVAEAADVSEEQAQIWIDEADRQLEAIEGLGSTYAERLREHGIETHADLAAADPDTVAEAADVSEDQAQAWIAESDRQLEALEDFEGIGSTYAEQLREHGIETPADLAAADPDTVAEAADVSEDQAEDWIEEVSR